MRFSHRVFSVVAQPCQIDFIDTSGRDQIYTPDYLVYFHQRNVSASQFIRPMLVEVKPA
ncbi:Uncharacterized protein AC514_3943 [Pseudomonas savastanoi pv. phaseolicola]|nr:Uncharacterized protein AC514_3943 [Pseudomonas savastanoi pv. phaseolicola]KPB48854.1 Uncharacterized protein AC513_1175 [Pseudomonas savastanoi pv. phaseolicola]KPB60974.1 Uncharacterized protein AC512_0526 [Pseudomonas savastanoi pv. phaseolicola]KPB64353.1 Uncharacterized protein AC508_0635 [Pseudomonas amygdali pv. mellea]